MTSLPGPLDYSKKKVMAFLFFLTDSGNQFFFRFYHLCVRRGRQECGMFSSSSGGGQPRLPVHQRTAGTLARYDTMRYDTNYPRRREKGDQSCEL